MRRFAGVLVAVTALAVTPVTTANASHDTCDGLKTQITGTGNAEKFTLTESKRIINAHGGNDVISADLSLDFPVTVCMGSGDDILRPGGAGWDAVPVRYLDGGAGFDRAEVYACFEGDSGPRIEVRNIERLTIVNCQD